MSTKERYGSAVWSAVQELSFLVEARMYCLLTVGEVAKKAGVSKPTAKKYLDLLAKEGYMHKSVFPSVTFYRSAYLSEE